MKVVPKIMSNVCLTAHPVGVAKEIEKQIEYIKKQGKLKGPKNVLILGCSGGYGLATRIAMAYACDSTTLGVSFERPGTETKLGGVGYYNNKAFSAFAKQDGLKEATLTADAFSNEGKAETLKLAKELFKGEKIDCVIYSLASPKRVDPVTGEAYKSVLKPIDQTYTGKTVDIFKGTISDVSVAPATEEEVLATIKVMGGEDWQLWIEALLEADFLAEKATTIAYSYIGPEITYPIYREGTIGKAKDHLENSAAQITATMKNIGGKAYVSVNKALVTRASSVIPVVPLYIALLFKIMQAKGTHEGCIEQEYRMIERIYNAETVLTDDKGRVRLDDWEMAADVQAQIADLWHKIDEETLKEVGNLELVRKDFMNLHGFEVEGVDYSADIDPR